MADLRRLAVIVSGALLIAGCARPPAREAVAHAVTLEGEIVDPQCYYTHGGRGLGHRSCALYCARGGQDMAFLNRAGDRLYPIIAARHGADPNEGLLAYVGYPVIVEGAWFGKDASRVLRVDRVRRLDGVQPSAPESVSVDPLPHPGAGTRE